MSLQSYSDDIVRKIMMARGGGGEEHAVTRMVKDETARLGGGYGVGRGCALYHGT